MVIPWILILLAGHATATPVWNSFHAPRPNNALPPLHHAQVPLAPVNEQPPQLDPIDKCLFTCDHCYKHPQTLIACANECIMSGGENVAMSKIWLQTCPQFLMPIYFDYQPMELR